MSQRWYATFLAGPLLVALFLAAVFVPLPFVTYSPGPTVDVLGTEQGQEIIQVTGHQTYRDNGQLRMTTVYVTEPSGSIGLFGAIEAWLSPNQAVYPRSVIYPDGETQDQSDLESSVQMVSSQDSAIAVALKQLGYRVKRVQEVINVADDMPAHDKLEVRDVLVKIGDTHIAKPQDVVTAIESSTAGQPLAFQIRRAGRPMTISVTPRLDKDGKPRVGIVPGIGFEFPFQVSVDVDPSIGGPSAGLMFALGIYDTLTPGSLTSGRVVAGTGTIAPNGTVGAIGGIPQKIVAAREAHARLFLVPADNCAEALGAPAGAMRLVKVTSMTDALSSVKTWAADPQAPLPRCTKGAG